MKLPSALTYARWLALLRIATGVAWLLHGVPKFVQSDSFMPPNGFMPMYVQRGIGLTTGPYHDFLVNVVQPHIGLFAELVRLGEVCVGLSLLFGLLTRLGGFFGIVLALDYMAARGALHAFMGWASIDACMFALSAVSFVLPTGRVFGIDRLMTPPGTPREVVHAEFVPEPPLEPPSGP